MTESEKESYKKIYKKDNSLVGLRLFTLMIFCCALIYGLSKIADATREIEVRFYAEDLQTKQPTYIYYKTYPGTTRITVKEKDTIYAKEDHIVTTPQPGATKFLIIKELSRQ